MKTWAVTAVITGCKFLGVVEAETREEAALLADKLESHVSLCHQCSGECEDPQVSDLIVEEE